MSAILKASPRYPSTIEIIKDAVSAIRASGTRVHAGDFGVYATSSHSRSAWELDPLARESGCNAIGAVLLHVQPPAADPPVAACLALGVSACWLEGFCSGAAVEAKDSRWMQSRQRDLYLAGYESGVCFRIWLKSFPELAS
jgi:hypothetical protein